MRIIVNEKQYKRLLKNQHTTKKYISEWVNYVEDVLYPYLNEGMVDDTLSIRNLRKKIGETPFFKKMPIETINVNLLRGDKGKVYLGEFQVQDKIIKELELDVYVNNKNNKADNFLEEFIKLHNSILISEQHHLEISDELIGKLTTEKGYSELEKEELIHRLKKINSDIFNATGSPMVVKDVNEKERSIIIENPNFTPEQISILLNKEGATDYWDMKLKNGDVEIKLKSYSWDGSVIGDYYDDSILVEPEIEPEEIDVIVDKGGEEIYNIPDVDYEHPPKGSFALNGLSSCYKDIMWMMSTVESKKHSYDSVNPGKILPGLSNLTIIEAYDYMVAMGGNEKTAMGRYQFLPIYLKGYANAAGIDTSTAKFSPLNQDKMVKAYLDKKFKSNDCLQVHDALVSRWAGLPILYPMKGKRRGESYYDSDINSAHISANKFQKLLYNCELCDSTKLKEKIKQTFPQGWDGATPIVSPNDETQYGGKIELNKRNFHKIPVGNNLWRSGQMTLEELEHVIKTKGIKNIVRMNRHDNTVYGGINNGTIVKPEEEKELAERLGVKYQFISAHKGYQSGKGYEETTNKVQPILNKGNTLIHCTHGADRTGGQVGRFMKDNTNYSDQELWDYTTQYNGWCNMGKSKFEGNSSTTKGGFDAYAQSFIDDIDYNKMKELCGKKSDNSKSVSHKYKGDIKILIIGDSQSVDDVKYGKYSNKLLSKPKYGGDVRAKVGAKTSWMLQQLKNIPKNKLKTYDYFIIFGGGNNSASKSASTAITQLKSMYTYIKENGKKGAKIIGVTPPNKKWYSEKTGKQYPSNDDIGKFVESQVGSNLDSYIELRNAQQEWFVDDGLHLNPAAHTLITNELMKRIK
jgi:hypothetical protein